MSDHIDHARCSELLRAYHSGETDDAEGAAVAAHLETCRDCAGELAAVKALAAPHDALGDEERRALRGRVAAELGLTRGRGRVVALPQGRAPSRRTRAGAALGAAAAVVLLVAGVAFVAGSGRDDAGDAAGGAGAETFEIAGPRPVFHTAPVVAAEAAPAEAADEAEPDALSEDAGVERNAGGGEGEEGAAGVPAILTRDSLVALGHAGEPFPSFAAAYEAPAAPEMQRAFLDALAAAAPGDLADQVLECGREVVSGNDRILPAYGATGRYRGEEVLVLGFVTAETAGAPFDGFQFFLWPRASCAIPITSIGGEITP